MTQAAARRLAHILYGYILSPLRSQTYKNQGSRRRSMGPFVGMLRVTDRVSTSVVISSRSYISR
ncbi:hypothetical protein DNTS_025407 [Danionella cerebrum]|uniref:Uncharacterized protein n=1 Tax=Danionella cerebrum TaxID=2873325 RepID=A0A553QH27_9TELE|nr:hypothetical protein DNTS_025407 [Danionella translucida]